MASGVRIVSKRFALICTFVAGVAIGQSTNVPSSHDGPTIRPAPPGPSCEWNPHEVLKSSGPQCGLNDLGIGNPGVYDCGQASNGKECSERCVFKRCQEI